MIYGSDIRTFPPDPSFTLTDEPIIVPEAIARRLTTQRGTLKMHPNYGFDVRQFLQGRVNQDTLFRVKSGVERECEADERVLSASVQVSFLPDANTLRLTIELELDEGPFTFVLAVTELSVTIVAPES